MMTRAELMARAEALGVTGLSDRVTERDLEAFLEALQPNSEFDATPLNLPAIEAFSQSGRTKLAIEFDADAGSGRVTVARDNRMMHRFDINKEGPGF